MQGERRGISALAWGVVVVLSTHLVASPWGSHSILYETGPIRLSRTRRNTISELTPVPFGDVVPLIVLYLGGLGLLL